MISAKPARMGSGTSWAPCTGSTRQAVTTCFLLPRALHVAGPGFTGPAGEAQTLCPVHGARALLVLPCPTMCVVTEGRGEGEQGPFLLAQGLVITCRHTQGSRTPSVSRRETRSFHAVRGLSAGTTLNRTEPCSLRKGHLRRAQRPQV